MRHVLSAIFTALLASPAARAQTLAELYQALPVTATIQARPSASDSGRVWAARPLRVRVWRQLDSLLSLRAGEAPGVLARQWQRGRLFRVAGAGCPHLLLIWEDILSACLVVLTPTFHLLDARQVARFDPPFWRLAGKRHVGISTTVSASQLICQSFRTTEVSHRFYSNVGPDISTRRVVTEYRISPAGGITLKAKLAARQS